MSSENNPAAYRPDVLLERLPAAHSIEPSLLRETLGNLIGDPSIAAEVGKNALTSAYRYQAHAAMIQQRLGLSHSDFMQLTESFSADQLYGWAQKAEELKIPASVVHNLLAQCRGSANFDANKTELLLKRFSHFIHQLSPIESITYGLSSTQMPECSISETVLDHWEQHLATARAKPELQFSMQRYAAWQIVTAMLKEGLGPCHDASSTGFILVYAAGAPTELLTRDQKPSENNFEQLSFIDLQNQLLPTGIPREEILPTAIEKSLRALVNSRSLVKKKAPGPNGPSSFDIASAVSSIPYWSKISAIIKALRSNSPTLEEVLCSAASSVRGPTEEETKPKVRSTKEISKEVSKGLLYLEQTEQYINDLLMNESPEGYKATTARISSAVGQMRKVLGGLTPAPHSSLSRADILATTHLLKPPVQFDRLRLCDYTAQSAMAITAVRNHLHLIVSGNGFA
jgi:hypothetical protein